MANNMKLIIIEQNGWKKEIKTEKAVIRIGSAPSNDIYLNSPQIASVHLQAHSLPTESECRVLNLGSKVIISRNDVQDVILPYAKAEIRDGDEVLLGEYRIQFELPFTTKMIQKADSLEASLQFPSTTISPHRATIGWLTIKNIGSQSPCQFHVSLSGLPADCIQIDPVPLLYSGAEEEVRIQLFHQTLYPSAGMKDLVIRVSAPNHYPREQVIIRQGIYVEPIFEQSLELVDDLGTEASPKQERGLNDEVKAPDFEQVSPPPTPTPVETPRQIDVEEEEEEEIPSPVISDAPPPVVEKREKQIENPALSTPAPTKIEDKVKKLDSPADIAPAKPVIVRSLPEDFWDEE